jgi:site-specific DNA recombinase
LRRRQEAIEKELEGVALQALEKSRLTQLNASIENFLVALRQSAKKLEVVERQKVVRLVIKQIVVNGDTLTIQHSIPISRSNESQPGASYALCTKGRRRPLLRCSPRNGACRNVPPRIPGMFRAADQPISPLAVLTEY